MQKRGGQRRAVCCEKVLLILFAMKRLALGNWLAGNSCSAYRSRCLGHANLHTVWICTVSARIQPSINSRDTRVPIKIIIFHRPNEEILLYQRVKPTNVYAPLFSSVFSL